MSDKCKQCGGELRVLPWDGDGVSGVYTCDTPGCILRDSPQGIVKDPTFFMRTTKVRKCHGLRPSAGYSGRNAGISQGSAGKAYARYLGVE